MPTWRAFLSSCTYIPSYLLTVSFSGPGKQPPSPFIRLPTPTPQSTPSPSSLPFCVCVCLSVSGWYSRGLALPSPREWSLHFCGFLPSHLSLPLIGQRRSLRSRKGAAGTHSQLRGANPRSAYWLGCMSEQRPGGIGERQRGAIGVCVWPRSGVPLSPSRRL